MITPILAVLFAITLPVGWSAHVTYNTKLRSALLRSSDPFAIPVMTKGENVIVNLSIDCIQFVATDLSQNLFAVTFNLEQKWYAENLVWDPLDYDDISTIRLDPDIIWKPDLAFYNVRSTKRSQKHFKEMICVGRDGLVEWVPSYTVETVCQKTNEEKYTVTCTLDIGSWTYSQMQLDLKSQTIMTTESFNDDGVYTITNYTITNISKKYECCPETFQTVTLVINFKRR